MRCTGGRILGLACASLGSHGRLWELLLRWEVAAGTAPGSFVPKSQLVSFCRGATESPPWMGMCRGLTAQPGTAPEPSPGPCPLRRALGLSGWPGGAARGMLEDVGTHPAWCPAIPLSVGSWPRSCSWAACEVQVMALRLVLGVWCPLGGSPCAVVWVLQLSAPRCPPKHGSGCTGQDGKRFLLPCSKVSSPCPEPGRAAAEPKFQAQPFGAGV